MLSSLLLCLPLTMNLALGLCDTYLCIERKDQEEETTDWSLEETDTADGHTTLMPWHVSSLKGGRGFNVGFSIMLHTRNVQRAARTSEIRNQQSGRDEVSPSVKPKSSISYPHGWQKKLYLAPALFLQL